MARKIITALDVGSSAIRIVVAEYGKDDSTPRIIALVEKEARGLRHGYIVNFEDITEAIREALLDAEKKAGIKIRRVVLGIGGITLSSQVAEGQTAVARADSEITELDVKRVISASENNLKDAANKKIVHAIPVSFKLDGKKVLGRPIGLKGNQLEVRTLFITSLAQHVEDLEHTIRQAGAAVEDIIAAPLAASFVSLTKVQKMAGCVLANIGAQTVSIVVFEEGIPVSLAVFPIGSMDITNDIALGLKIPIEEAEQIKTGAKQFGGARRKLDEIIEARLSDVFELIEAHLRKISRSGLLPAGVIITGGGAGVPNVEAHAKEALGLPARVLTEIPALVGREGTNIARKEMISSMWAVTYGLSVLGGDFEAEESIGVKMARETKNNILSWFKQLLP